MSLNNCVSFSLANKCIIMMLVIFRLAWAHCLLAGFINIIMSRYHFLMKALARGFCFSLFIYLLAKTDVAVVGWFPVSEMLW